MDAAAAAVATFHANEETARGYERIAKALGGNADLPEDVKFKLGLPGNKQVYMVGCAQRDAHYLDAIATALENRKPQPAATKDKSHA